MKKKDALCILFFIIRIKNISGMSKKLLKGAQLSGCLLMLIHYIDGQSPRDGFIYFLFNPENIIIK